MMLLRALRDDSSGATIVEFAMIAPVLLLTVMGLFDMGHSMYISSILHGAIQKAARDSTIEGATNSEVAIDARVTAAVHRVVKNASPPVFTRKIYSNFTDVNQPEDFDDIDGNGSCNGGETFEDANGNGVWDADKGMMGFGGARDAVIYSVSVTYPRVFPVAALIGLPSTNTLVTDTVLRNQPFAGSSAITVTTGTCP